MKSVNDCSLPLKRRSSRFKPILYSIRHFHYISAGMRTRLSTQASTRLLGSLPALKQFVAPSWKGLGIHSAHVVNRPMHLTEFLDRGNRVVCHRHRQRQEPGQTWLVARSGNALCRQTLPRTHRRWLETNILTWCASVTDRAVGDETAAMLTLNLLHVPRRGHGQDLVRVSFDSTLRDDRSHSGRHSEGALLRV